MSDAVLSVRGLSKKYSRDLRRALWYGVRDLAGELALRSRPNDLRRGEFWALDDVSFELRRGESLVVAGANGAGKSTLLKLLCGLLKPDRGEVRLRGKVEALMELGTGFHPLLTGRENIRVGAALYGLPARAVNALVDEVVAFAELEEFIDTPMQSYSSGMRARLAYALAAHLQPDVLLVDEVLAVGDVAFQRKCVDHMRGFIARGGSLLLVSHNTYQIQAVCERGILLEHGKLTFAGTAVETVHRMLESRIARAPLASKSANASGPVVIEEVRVSEACTGEPLRITLRYRTDERLDVSWGFGIWTGDQHVCVTGDSGSGVHTIEGRGELTCTIPKLPLLAGRYVMRAAIVDPEHFYPLALHGWHDAGLVFDVRSPADAITNAQVRLGQLVKVDVDWN